MLPIMLGLGVIFTQNLADNLDGFALCKRRMSVCVVFVSVFVGMSAVCVIMRMPAMLVLFVRMGMLVAVFAVAVKMLSV